MTSAQRMGVLIMEDEQLRTQLLHLRQQSSKRGVDGARVQLEIAEVEIRLRRNTLETLDCQLALQRARISRFDSAEPTDTAVSDALRVLTTGLTTLQTRRERAERELRAAELAFEQRRAKHAARRPGATSTTDQD